MKIAARVAFSGRYQASVFHGDDLEPYFVSDWSDNIVTNNGLDLLGTGFVDYCWVGTDATPESATDTQITNAVRCASQGSDAAVGTQYSEEPYYGYCRTHYTWGIGAVQMTISEIGVGAASNNLFSRSLLKLLDGTPTTITLGGVDRLEVTYELRQYIDTTPVAYSMDVDGVTTTGVIQPAEIDNCHGWGTHTGQRVGTSHTFFYDGGSLGALTGSPSPGGNGAEGNGTLAAYVPGSHTLSYSATLLWSVGNKLSISAIRIGGDWFYFPDCNATGGTWQFSLDPPVAKTDTDDFRIEFEFSWERYE